MIILRGLITIGIMSEPYVFFDFHKHNTWEIIYIFHGVGTVTVGEVDVPFMPGTIICFPPNIPHREIAKAGYRDYYFTVEAFNNQFKGIPCFHDNEHGDFLNIIKQMYRQYHMKHTNWRDLSESLLTVLNQYMLAWSEEHKKVPLIETLKNLLLSNISNPNFSLEKALEELPLSQNHIRKVFKRETGMSPLKYLHVKRITYAQDLLASRKASGYKIKEIASLCGFDDPYYFSRLFKEHTGVSPESWVKPIALTNNQVK